MENATNPNLPPALALLSSERPRTLNWFQAGALLFGDWGTSRLYVLGLAFLVAGRTSFWLIAMMSGLILAVAWAYTQICRIYPDGGGVYTAAKARSRVLGVIGALLLFADYTVTASMSAVDAFHYFGLGPHHTSVAEGDPGSDIRLKSRDPNEPEEEKPAHEQLWNFRSPGLWAMVAILAVGALNLMGPKHTAGFALFAAAGMIIITLMIVCVALPFIDWRHLDLGSLHQPPLELWRAFVFVVLALSGVEAIANLTGVMHRPVYATARKSIWLVAAEVAALNLLLAIAMVALAPGRHAHTGDMLAFIAHHTKVGVFGEWVVRIIGGLLLLSATNTAVNGLMSIAYVMSRDNELPAFLQKLNSFGAPWAAAIVATAAPVVVLLFAHDLETLASLYAIGVVGAVTINCTLCAFHPRLRKTWRKAFMGALGVLLAGIWITLACTKLTALLFVAIVLTGGLILRAITKYAGVKRPKLSLLQQAIREQLSPRAFDAPKYLLATAGSARLAEVALRKAKADGMAVVVCFIRDVALSYKVAPQHLTLDSDPAAISLFTSFLRRGHEMGVPVIPAYDSGQNAPELIAELAAIHSVSKVLIGSSRRSLLHHAIKGSFQNSLESLLPDWIEVDVLHEDELQMAAGFPVVVEPAAASTKPSDPPH